MYSKTIKILAQNIQSIKNKTGELDLILDTIKPDILCINEHWLKTCEITHLKLSNYCLETFFCRTTINRGGVSIYSSTSFKGYFEAVEDFKLLSIENDFECCGIIDKKNKCNVISLYRTPAGNLEIFFSKFEELLGLTDTPGYQNFICGDINIDVSSNTPASQNLQQMLLSHSYRLTINEPTRITATSSTIIDNIITNSSNILYAKPITTALSDHEAVMTEFIPSPCNDCNITRTQHVRFFHQESLDYFRFLIKNESWENVVISNDANTAFNEFLDTFLIHFNSAFTKKLTKTTNKPYDKASKHWITCELRYKCEHKRSLYELQKKFPCSEYKTAYKTFGNKLKAEIAEAKKKSNSNFIKSNGNSVKKMWEVIKPNKKCDNKITIKINDDTKVDNPIIVGNMFNQFFANITKNIKLSSPNLANVGEKKITNSFFVKPYEVNEVWQLIMSLTNKNSSGWDEIPSKTIKAVVDLIAIPLTHAINISVETGTFPEKLKCAVIKPIYKNGNKNEITNYRPIALLSSFSKIYEKAMFLRLSKFLSKFKVISEEQNGFQKNKNTSLAAFQAMMEMTEALENGETIAAVFCDLSKAFDSVHHELLLEKLDKYGIRGLQKSWFQSYLSNRSQCVEIERVRSTWETVTRGVPQGSILGPVLFLLYINDMSSFINYKSILFADDATVIYRAPKSIESSHDDISQLLKTLECYFSNNSLNLNIKKTEALIFDRTQNTNQLGNSPYTIQVANCSVKFLGIHIDHKLNFSSHTSQMASKVCSLAFLLKELQRTCNLQTAKVAYYAYAESLIRYGIIVWGHCTGAKTVFTAQKRCVRNLVGAHRLESCKPIFKNLGIMTLPALYTYETANFVRQHSNYFMKHIIDHPHDTRNKKTFQIPHATKAVTRKGVLLSMMKTYNSVPDSIKSLNNKQFRVELKKKLIEDCPYKIEM